MLYLCVKPSHPGMIDDWSHRTSTRCRTLQLPWGRFKRRLGPLRRLVSGGFVLAPQRVNWDINWGVLDVWYGLIIDPRFFGWWMLVMYFMLYVPCWSMLHMLIPGMSLAEVDKNQEMCGSNPRQMGHGMSWVWGTNLNKKMPLSPNGWRDGWYSMQLIHIYRWFMRILM